jgi:hypothetical protein
MMIEGSGSRAGSGSEIIPLTSGSGSGYGRPKNMWIRIRIRIRITAFLGLRQAEPLGVPGERLGVEADACRQLAKYVIYRHLLKNL